MSDKFQRLIIQIGSMFPLDQRQARFEYKLERERIMIAAITGDNHVATKLVDRARELEKQSAEGDNLFDILWLFQQVLKAGGKPEVLMVATLKQLDLLRMGYFAFGAQILHDFARTGFGLSPKK